MTETLQLIRANIGVGGNGRIKNQRAESLGMLAQEIDADAQRERRPRCAFLNY